jgi:microsomal prostaglandin-E synthase 2
VRLDWERTTKAASLRVTTKEEVGRRLITSLSIAHSGPRGPSAGATSSARTFLLTTATNRPANIKQTNNKSHSAAASRAAATNLRPAAAAAAACAPARPSAGSLSTSARAAFAYGGGGPAAAAGPASRAFSPAAAATLAALAAGGAAAVVSSTPAQASASVSASPAAPAAAAKDPYAPPPSAGSRGRPTAVTLYQYEVCPFCCKVKSFLDYHRVPYRVVEVNPLTKAELKGLAAEVEQRAAAAALAAGAATTGASVPAATIPSLKKVPVVRLAYADGGAEDVVADSSVIISRLAAELGVFAGGVGAAAAGGGVWGSGSGGGGAPAASTAAAADEARWRRWADERLVKTITANIYRSWDESWQTFSYITREAGDAWGWAAREGARVAGSVLMWRVGSGMPKKYGIEGDLRAALYRDLDAFVDAVDAGAARGGGDKAAAKGGGGGKAGAPAAGGGAGGRFLGGAAPNLGDLAVYGVIRAIRGTNTYNDMVAHSRILPWLQRMDAAVGEGSRLA